MKYNWSYNGEVLYTKDDINKLYESIIDDLYDHYWDTLENNREIAIEHCKSVLERRFSKDD